jgi:hypothetical protein
MKQTNKQSRPKRPTTTRNGNAPAAAAELTRISAMLRGVTCTLYHCNTPEPRCGPPLATQSKAKQD